MFAIMLAWTRRFAKCARSLHLRRSSRSTVQTQLLSRCASREPAGSSADLDLLPRVALPSTVVGGGGGARKRARASAKLGESARRATRSGVCVSARRSALLLRYTHRDHTVGKVPLVAAQLEKRAAHLL